MEMWKSINLENYPLKFEQKIAAANVKVTRSTTNQVSEYRAPSGDWK